MSSTQIWISAFRLRTLPLALSATTLGSLLGYAENRFKWGVFVFGTLTSLFLQILSNLANDYGDARKGTDNEHRLGPLRVTQAGLVSHSQIRWMIGIFVILSLVSGSLLIWTGLRGDNMVLYGLFFVLGFSAIFAAIKYTIGKRPYGYLGFGDIMVFIYFGILGVAGTYFLHTHSLHPTILLPASSVGLFSMGVLNLNNLRDRENDAINGKNTLVVRMGVRWAKAYHVVLLLTALVLAVLFTILHFESYYQLIFLLPVPLLISDITTVITNTVPVELNRELKRLAVATLLFSISFGIGLVLEMVRASYIAHPLVFIRPAGTSRGVLEKKPCWFISLTSEEGVRGIGEVSFVPGLSVEDQEELEIQVDHICKLISRGEMNPLQQLPALPGVQFALETAVLDMEKGGTRILYPSEFTEGKAGIPTNGLIWMGSKSFMISQIREKVKLGFKVLKMKVGSLDFSVELDLVSWIRSDFGAADLEIRLDANGAWKAEEARKNIELLARLGIHSIEQPIAPGQSKEMAELCRDSAIAVALDEELIGISDSKARKRIMENLRPPYIIIKPGLLGGFSVAEDWIALAEQFECGWWITSALESSVGLNAIAQWSWQLGVWRHQGLGTGLLYTNNINSPLVMRGELLWHLPGSSWDMNSIGL